MTKFTCTKCHEDCYSADGQKTVKCPTCGELAQKEEV